MIKLRIVGIPVRHRIGAAAYTPKGGGDAKALIYSEAKARKWKKSVHAQAQFLKPDNWKLLTGPVVASITFYMPLLKSFSKKKRAAILAGEEIPHTVKPDRLSLLRPVEDALTGVIWRDDAQVYDGRVRKIYGEPPGVLVEISQLGEDSNGL